MGTLYLVATPIGNLEDISARALRILAQVELIAAEDTRQTRKLLDRYQIRTALLSYHEHNKLTKLESVLTALSQGDVALVSDAGTPVLNDPGYELVTETLKAGFEVSPIPGPCAPVAALVASGLPTDSFLYLGYLPKKTTARRRKLASIENYTYTLIFLESPHRLLASLDDIIDILGDRQIAVAREMTKLYEEIFRGRLSEAIEHFTENPPRGEFTLILAGCHSNGRKWTEEQVLDAIEVQSSHGESPSRIAKQVSEISNWPRREVYDLLKKNQ
jgi:16S rRNA (cytidine1402-2'-O)-methyltransferase